MYLSNRDIRWAIECGKLIVDPPPDSFGTGYDETSIELHLDAIDQGARVWDIEAYNRDHQHPRRTGGNPPLVFRRRDPDEVVVQQFGFLLWTTKEIVGTPVVELGSPTATQRHPELICFVNAKSSQARTGLLVHFTAPTIHAGWSGKITLEITNLGPFDFVLRENDTLAQLTVATVSSAPDLSLKKTTRRKSK